MTTDPVVWAYMVLGLLISAPVALVVWQEMIDYYELNPVTVGISTVVGFACWFALMMFWPIIALGYIVMFVLRRLDRL